nr:hypothetical protein [Paracoccus sp. S-4012]
MESWVAPRRVVRGLSDFTEPALLALLMAAMMVFLLAQAPGHARAATLDPTVPLDVRIAGAMMGVIFILPLLAYTVALIVSLAARLTPWRIEPRHSRLALFWALLAVAPAMLLTGLTAGLIGPGPALVLTNVIAGLGFLVIWGAGLSTLAVRA